jgi:uncharacterized protein YaaN involved in tellurite resistance
MVGKPKYEELSKRVTALESDITALDKQNETLRKACKDGEYRIEGSTAKLRETEQQLRNQLERRAVTDQKLKNSQYLMQTLPDTVEKPLMDRHSLFVDRAVFFLPHDIY